VKTVLVPAGNERHLSEIPEDVRKELSFVPVSSFDQVLRRALARRKSAGGAATRGGGRSTPIMLPPAVDAPAARSHQASRFRDLREAA
jgi:ATP-dependent Lon protease